MSSSASPVTSPDTSPAVEITQPVLTSPSPLPPYALKHAPLIHLYSKETHWPSSIIDHLKHSIPTQYAADHPEIESSAAGKLGMLKDNLVNSTSTWLKNETDPRRDRFADGLVSAHCKPGEDGKSKAEAWIIAVDKSTVIEPGVVDVFYFYFYSYNHGNKVVGINFGNHVGDWEHIMIRFKEGVPQAIHLSAHSDGHAYTWEAIEKKGDRPVVYSAAGSHAFYATAGSHRYSPAGIVGPIDHTDHGPIWDATLNYVAASCDLSSWNFTALASDASDGSITADDVIAVLGYGGRWGDSFSTLKEGQKSLSTSQKLKKLVWAEGPTGPRDKSLDRKGMNRTNGEVKTTLRD